MLILSTTLLGVVFQIWKTGERRSRDWLKEQQAQQIAALRPPPKPPNCPDLPLLSKLRLSDGSIPNVRIFKFGRTIYFVPSAWLYFSDPVPNIATGGVRNADMLGRADPDLHAVECPGVVHQITGDNMYAGISFEAEGYKGDRRVSDPIYIDGAAQMLRPDRELWSSYQKDGILLGIGHDTPDAYIRVAPDVGLRVFGWHPQAMTFRDWDAQYQRYYIGLLMRTSPKPWEASLKTSEFRSLASRARALHAWLVAAPNRRSPEPPK